jgi:hypothetical protein
MKYMYIREGQGVVAAWPASARAVRAEFLVRRRGLAKGREVITMHPCIFAIQNHHGHVQGGGA